MMKKIKEKFYNLSNFQKITCSIVLIALALFISMGIPTMARYNNKTIIDNTPTWDNTIATSYNSGTGIKSNPYVISNSSEFLYFSRELLNNNYENTYFKLSNNLVINSGTFNYDVSSGLTYVLDNITYYVDTTTYKYYSDIEKTNEVGILNAINPLSNFKGVFDGDLNVIYGAYITSDISSDLALFSSLEGTLKNLYVENVFVDGGNYASGLVSKANNANVSNVLVSGFVVGNSTLGNINEEFLMPDKIITLSNVDTTTYIDLDSNIPIVGSEIISTSITGTYTLDNLNSANIIKINGNIVNNGTFDIDLGNTILNSIPIVASTDSTDPVSLAINNIKYNITYKYGVSAGVVGIANNTVISNAANKANIYGSGSSGGIVGTSILSTNITNSYNTGNVIGTYTSGGLVGIIEENTISGKINKSYNCGNITATNIGGIIGVVSNNNTIEISNAFNTSTTNYDIGTILNTNISITNSYKTNHLNSINSGVATGNFADTTTANLQNKAYMTETLLYSEFIDSTDILTNVNNVWIYENNSYPHIYIDHEMLPTIHVSTYSWDRYNYTLNTISLNNNITFSIEDALGVSQYLSKYYYVSNSINPLSKSELDNIVNWTLYEDVTQITANGDYIIYAKIVDYDGKVYYINTDILRLDSISPEVTAVNGDNSYSNLRTDLNNLYTGTIPNIVINATDNLSGVASLAYYIGNSVLDEMTLNLLPSESWINYTNSIELNSFGTYVIYVKAVDNFNNVTYVNSDYIIYKGYAMNDIVIGMNNTSYNETNTYITNKSTVTLNYEYSFNESSFSNNTHNLVSSILLPMGTKINLVDNITNKVYQYIVNTNDDIFGYADSCNNISCKKATYPFTLFKEIGKSNASNFIETDYISNGVSNENFSIILDFSNTNITSNFANVCVYLELHNSNSNIRPTLTSTLKTFNIYSLINNNSSNASLFITSNYAGTAINLNSNSITTININSGLNYKTINGNNVIDTSFENKKIGLAIKLVDDLSNTVNKGYLKNLRFSIGENSYSMESDNIVHINLDHGIDNLTSELVITTSQDNVSLRNGIYYLKIYAYASYDGYYYDELSNQVLTIPVNVVNGKNDPYSFDVLMDDSSRVINKLETESITFNILQKGYLANPSIRVSLYEKRLLTAYNQDYTLVNLSTYVTNSLISSGNNTYVVTNTPAMYDGTSSSYNNFIINLLPNNFDNTGYKFVFDLYDGTKKIDTIEKKIIVK